MNLPTHSVLELKQRRETQTQRRISHTAEVEEVVTNDSMQNLGEWRNTISVLPIIIAGTWQ